MSHHHGGGSSSSEPLGKSARNRIHNITGEQVQRLLLKLDAISPHLPFLSSLPMQELTSPRDYMPGEVAPGGNGGEASSKNAGMGRHVHQESSILGHLRRIGTFVDDDDEELLPCRHQCRQTAVEFGAGTGRLSERLQRCVKQGMKHILIDRQEFAPNQCRDGAMRNRAGDIAGSSVERITGDIADFKLGQYCSYIDIGDNGDKNSRSSLCKCFCMSKHLCGPACDLAIASLGGKDVPICDRPPFAFATCCHYLCTWESFAGKEYWLRLGLSEEDFEVAVAASQWYSLRGGKKKRNLQEKEVVTTCNDMYNNSSCSVGETITQKDLMSMIDGAGEAVRCLNGDALCPSMPSEEFERSFTRDEKAKLGGVVKRLLDLSRIARLQELGYEAELVLYTTRSIENRLLVGSIDG